MEGWEADLDSSHSFMFQFCFKAVWYALHSIEKSLDYYFASKTFLSTVNIVLHAFWMSLTNMERISNAVLPAR